MSAGCWIARREDPKIRYEIEIPPPAYFKGRRRLVMNPIDVPQHSWVVQAVARNHREVMGHPPATIGAILPMSYSAGYACWLWEAGIPSLYYGPRGGFLDQGPDGAYMFISEMVDCAKVLALTALEACGHGGRSGHRGKMARAAVPARAPLRRRRRAPRGPAPRSSSAAIRRASPEHSLTATTCSRTSRREPRDQRRRHVGAGVASGLLWPRADAYRRGAAAGRSDVRRSSPRAPRAAPRRSMIASARPNSASGGVGRPSARRHVPAASRASGFAPAIDRHAAVGDVPPARAPRRAPLERRQRTGLAHRARSRRSGVELAGSSQIAATLEHARGDVRAPRAGVPRGDAGEAHRSPDVRGHVRAPARAAGVEGAPRRRTPVAREAS